MARGGEIGYAAAMLFLEIAAGLWLGLLLLAFLPALLCGALIGFGLAIVMATIFAAGFAALVFLLLWPAGLYLAIVLVAIGVVIACAHRESRWQAQPRA